MEIISAEREFAPNVIVFAQPVCLSHSGLKEVNEVFEVIVACDARVCLDKHK